MIPTLSFKRQVGLTTTTKVVLMGKFQFKRLVLTLSILTQMMVQPSTLLLMIKKFIFGVQQTKLLITGPEFPQEKKEVQNILKKDGIIFRFRTLR